jgi:hypothetical protein
MNSRRAAGRAIDEECLHGIAALSPDLRNRHWGLSAPAAQADLPVAATSFRFS